MLCSRHKKHRTVEGNPNWHNYGGVYAKIGWKKNTFATIEKRN